MIGSFLQENDIVVAETGTSSFGMISTALPKGATLVSQVLYGSIGWATGSTLGCLLAAKESPVPRRVILFTGDGSIQLTVQDIATMLKHNLKPILVVLNNDGCEYLSTLSLLETLRIDHFVLFSRHDRTSHSRKTSCLQRHLGLELARFVGLFRCDWSNSEEIVES